MGAVFIPLHGGSALADTLSRGVYRLSQPDGIRPGSYVTTHAFAWLVHPETAAVVLELDDEQFVPLHVAADPQPLLDLLAELKDDHDQPLTTAEERAQLAAAVQMYGGQRVPLSMLVPAKAAAEAMTREQLETDGWFDAPLLEEGDAAQNEAGNSEAVKGDESLAAQSKVQQR